METRIRRPGRVRSSASLDLGDSHVSNTAAGADPTAITIRVPRIRLAERLRLVLPASSTQSSRSILSWSARAISSHMPRRAPWPPIPSRSYNPLFIYGGTGMGKTHLLHAIGHRSCSQHSGDAPSLHFERALHERDDHLASAWTACRSFHQRYRSADVLLVDDIQLLGNKERTQEEFFHTFNELHDHQKQIVISSDCPPKDIPGLVERLRSRFEWGLMADMQPPDLETKMAILDKKAGIGRHHAARGCALLHGLADQIERARTGRRAGETDRLFFADGNADQSCRWRSRCCATWCTPRTAR